MNSLEAKEGWLTLHEASTMTGIKIPTLRMAIKRGKYPGERVPTANGHKWLIAVEALKPGKEYMEHSERISRSYPCSGEQESSPQQVLIGEQRERIREQSRHIATLEELVEALRRESMTLKEDYRELKEKMALLPSPVEEVLETLDGQLGRIKELELTLEELSAQFEREKKRAWW